MSQVSVKLLVKRVDLGGVEERDAFLDRRPDQGNHLLLVTRRAVTEAHAHSVSLPVAKLASVKGDKTIANKGELALFDAACLVLSNIQKWCAIQGSNL
jgi:hypothetical protein